IRRGVSARGASRGPDALFGSGPSGVDRARGRLGRGGEFSQAVAVAQRFVVVTVNHVWDGRSTVGAVRTAQTWTRANCLTCVRTVTSAPMPRTRTVRCGRPNLRCMAGR